MSFGKCSRSRCAFTWHEKYLTTFLIPIYYSEFLFYGRVKIPLHEYLFLFFYYFVNKSHKNFSYGNWALRVLQSSTADTKLSAIMKKIFLVSQFWFTWRLSLAFSEGYFPPSVCLVALSSMWWTCAVYRKQNFIAGNLTSAVLLWEIVRCKVLFFLFDL